MSAFLDRLDARLKRKLKGWETMAGALIFSTTGARAITSRNLSGERVIGLDSSATRHGGRIDIGISWETNNTRKQAALPRTLGRRADDTPFSQMSNPWWEALRDPALTCTRLEKAGCVVANA